MAQAIMTRRVTVRQIEHQQRKISNATTFVLMTIFMITEVSHYLILLSSAGSSKST